MQTCWGFQRGTQSAQIMVRGNGEVTPGKKTTDSLSLSVCLSTCLSFRLSVCLFLCISPSATLHFSLTSRFSLSPAFSLPLFPTFLPHPLPPSQSLSARLHISVHSPLPLSLSLSLSIYVSLCHSPPTPPPHHHFQTEVNIISEDESYHSLSSHFKRDNYRGRLWR